MIVTGVSPGGIGQETARAIATQEPELLVIAGGDPVKLDVSYKAIKAAAPRVNMQVVFLDLGSLHSVREGARKMLDLGEPNILINNAAVMRAPYSLTEDGFEIHFGVNYNRSPSSRKRHELRPPGQ